MDWKTIMEFEREEQLFLSLTHSCYQGDVKLYSTPRWYAKFVDEIGTISGWAVSSNPEKAIKVAMVQYKYSLENHLTGSRITKPIEVERERNEDENEAEKS